MSDVPTYIEAVGVALMAPLATVLAARRGRARTARTSKATAAAERDAATAKEDQRLARALLIESLEDAREENAVLRARVQECEQREAARARRRRGSGTS